MSFNDWLSRRQLYTPDKTAIIDDGTGRTYTYSVLNRRANRLARYLQRQFRVKPKMRVACLSVNNIEYVDLYFACGKIGAILVPLNYRLRQHGIREMVIDCRPRLLVYESTYTALAAALHRDGCVKWLMPIHAEYTPHPAATVAEVVEHGGDQAPEIVTAHETDIAMILYTSGTTATPKGAMISWRQIHWNAVNTTISLQLTESDITFLNTPLYHTGGWHVLFTPLMYLGGTVILQKQFDAERCNALMGPAGVTILFGIPTMLGMMTQAPNFDAADFSSVRFAICGGEPCPIPVIRAYQEKDVPMRQGYGLTEVGPNCFSLPAQDALRKEGSVGFPNFHVQVKILGDSGAPVMAGEVGELVMGGPQVFSGYWNNPEASRETLRSGWVYTGDLFRQDEDGYYFIVGREKDMFISGGENVYPPQVERVIYAHPSVAQAAVIGVPDAKWGESGCAFVVLHPGATLAEKELMDYCKETLASYQCPKSVVFSDHLPVGHSGKVDKKALREMLLAQLQHD
jgi:fatty-acyl-CoA synthase